MSFLSKNYKKLVICCLTVLIIITLSIKVLNSPNILCQVAEGIEEPSTPFYMVIERIYTLYNKKEIENEFIQYLSNNKNRHLHDLYLRILGVAGSKKALPYIRDIYLKYQNDPNHKATLFYTIKSIGLIGKNEAVPFLETLLKKSEKLNLQVSESNIATSLYLITGNNHYHFVNSSGRKQKLFLTKELIEARKVIRNSLNRDRTVQEMLILDKLYRPQKLSRIRVE